MQNFQGIIFISIGTYREIFKSALEHLKYRLNYVNIGYILVEYQ